MGAHRALWAASRSRRCGPHEFVDSLHKVGENHRARRSSFRLLKDQFAGVRHLCGAPSERAGALLLAAASLSMDCVIDVAFAGDSLRCVIYGCDFAYCRHETLNTLLFTPFSAHSFCRVSDLTSLDQVSHRFVSGRLTCYTTDGRTLAPGTETRVSSNSFS